MPDPVTQTPGGAPIPPPPGATLPPDDLDALPTAGDPNSDPIPPTMPPAVPSPQEGDSMGEVTPPPPPPGS